MHAKSFLILFSYYFKDDFPDFDEDEDDKKYFNIEDQINEEDIKCALRHTELVFESNSSFPKSNKNLALISWLKSIETGDYQCLNKKIKWIDNWEGKHKGIYHPMDLIYYVIKNSNIPDRRKFYKRLFVCKLSIPVLLPKKKLLYMDLSLRNVGLMWKNSSDQVCEKNAADAELPVVSLLRFGKQSKNSISKSKLGNDLLKVKFENGLGGYGYFTRESLSSNSLRKASNGLVEAMWFQKSSCEETFQKSFCMLNLRGDALQHIENACSLVNASDVVLFLCDTEMFEDNRYKELLAEMARRTKESARMLKIVILMTKEANAKIKENLKMFKSISENIVYLIIDKEPVEFLKSVQNKINKYLVDILESNNSLNTRFDKLKNESLKEKKSGALEVSALLLKEMGRIRDSEDTLRHKVKKDLFPLQSIVKFYAQKQREETRCTDLKKKYAIQRELSDLKASQYKSIKSGLSVVMWNFITYLIACDEPNLLSYIYCVQDKLDIWCKENISAIKTELNISNKKLNNLKESLSQEDNWIQKEKVQKEIVCEINTFKNLKNKITDISVGVENLFREIGQIFETVSRYEKEKELPAELVMCSKKLPELAALCLLKGLAIEIMDGDGLNVPVNWIFNVFYNLRKYFKEYFGIDHEPNIFVLTVLGTQSTGKSTLLNTMFGLEYPVGSGRCIKGAFLQLVPLSFNKCNFDAIFVIDTEGLGAPENYGNNTHDNEIATLVLGISDLIIINVMGELPTNVENFLQISTCALMRMNLVDFHPSCIFVHQNCGSSSKDKNFDSRNAFMEMMDQAVITQAKLNKTHNRFNSFQDIVKVSLEKNFFYFPQFLDSSSSITPMSSEYISACETLKKFISKEFLEKNTMIQTFDDFTNRLQLIWNGVLEKNFVLSLLNSAEIQIKHEVDNEMSDWKSNIEKHLSSCTDVYCNEISAFFKNKQDENQKLEFSCNAANKMFLEKKELLKRQAKVINELRIEAFQRFIDKKTSNKNIYKNWEQQGINSMTVVLDSLVNSCQNRMTKWFDYHDSSHEWKFELFKAKTAADAKARQVANNLLKEKEALNNGNSFKYSDEECAIEFDHFWISFEKDFTSKRYFDFQKVDIKDQFLKTIVGRYRNTPNFNRHLKLFNEKIPQRTLLSCLKNTNPQHFKKRKPDIETLIKETKKILLKELEIENVDGFEKLKIQRSEDFDGATLVEKFVRRTISLLKKTNSSLIKPPLELSDEFIFIFSLHICQLSTSLFESADDYFYKYVDVKRKIVEGKESTKSLFMMILKKEGNLAITANQIATLLLNTIYSNVIKSIPGAIKEMFLKRVPLKEHIHGLVLLDVIDALQYDSLTDSNIKYLNDYFHKPFTLFENKIRDILNACQNINIKEIFNWELRLQINATELFVKNIVADKEKDLLSQLCDHPHILGLGIGKSDFRTIQMPMMDNDKRIEDESEILKKLSSNILAHDHRLVSLNTAIKLIMQQVIADLSRYLFACQDTCPFCSAPCDNTHISESKHSCQSHRPEGFGSFYWCETNKFVLDICNETIKTSASFKNEATNGKYVKYAKYMTVGESYSSWDIKGLASDQLQFWKYITYRIMPHLKTFFPSVEKVDVKQWSGILKKEAMEAVIKKFHILSQVRLENDSYII